MFRPVVQRLEQRFRPDRHRQLWVESGYSQQTLLLNESLGYVDAYVMCRFLDDVQT